MNKNKILIWAVVLLVILNITTIGTVFYHNYQEKTNSQTIVVDLEGKNPLNGRYFRQILRFDNTQMEAFRIANREFRPKANNIIVKIDSLKNEMFIELKKAQTDTAKLNLMSLKVGVLHTELKQETNRFYLKIKKVCTPQQLEKMQTVFTPLYSGEPCNGQGTNCNGQGKGRGNGFRNQQNR